MPDSELPAAPTRTNASTGCPSIRAAWRRRCSNRHAAERLWASNSVRRYEDHHSITVSRRRRCVPRSRRVRDASARARPGSIGGVVRGTCGAVLTGATIEASSPVLIEKSRTAVSDAETLSDDRVESRHLHGHIHALRFQSVKREAIELTGSLTATSTSRCASDRWKRR